MADSIYNATMTIESCEELNRITDQYIRSLTSISDCVQQNEREEFNSQLSFLESSIIEDCN